MVFPPNNIFNDQNKKKGKGRRAFFDIKLLKTIYYQY